MTTKIKCDDCDERLVTYNYDRIRMTWLNLICPKCGKLYDYEEKFKDVEIEVSDEK